MIGFLLYFCKSIDENKASLFNFINKYFADKIYFNEIYHYLKTDLTMDNIIAIINSLASTKESRIPDVIDLSIKEKLVLIHNLFLSNIDLSFIFKNEKYINFLKHFINSFIFNELCKMFNVNAKKISLIIVYILDNYHKFNLSNFLNNTNVDANFSRTTKIIQLLFNKKYTLTQMNQELGLNNFDQIKYIAENFNRNTSIGMEFTLSLISSANYPIKLLITILSEYPRKLTRFNELLYHSCLIFNEAYLKKKINQLCEFFSSKFVKPIVQLLILEIPQLKKYCNFFMNCKKDNNINNFFGEIEKKRLVSYIEELNRILLATGDELIRIFLKNISAIDIIEKYINGTINGTVVNVFENFDTFFQVFKQYFYHLVLSDFQTLNEFVQWTEKNWFNILDWIIGNKLTSLSNIYIKETAFKKYCTFLLTGKDNYANLPDKDIKYLSLNTFQNSLSKYGYAEFVNFVLGTISSNLHFLINENKQETEWYKKIQKLNLTILKLMSKTTTVNEVLDSIKPGLSNILPIMENIFFEINNNKTLKEIISSIDKNFWDAEYFMRMITESNKSITMKAFPNIFTCKKCQYQFNIKTIIKPITILINIFYELFNTPNYITKNIVHLKEIHKIIKSLLDELYSLFKTKPFSKFIYKITNGNINIDKQIVSFILIMESIKNNENVNNKRFFNAIKGKANVDITNKEIKYYTANDKYEINKLLINHQSIIIGAFNIIENSYVPIKVRRLSLTNGSNVTTRKLLFSKEINLFGKSSISPLDISDSISFKVIGESSLNFYSTLEGIPSINFGLIGDNNALPKKFYIHINLSNYNNTESIKKAFLHPVKIASGCNISINLLLHKKTTKLKIIGHQNQNILKLTYNKSGPTENYQSIYIVFNDSQRNKYKVLLMCSIIIGCFIVVLVISIFIVSRINGFNKFHKF